MGGNIFSNETTNFLTILWNVLAFYNFFQLKSYVWVVILTSTAENQSGVCLVSCLSVFEFVLKCVHFACFDVGSFWNRTGVCFGWIHSLFLRFSHNTPCLPPKFCTITVFNSLGTTVIRRGNEKQTLRKRLGGANKVNFGRCANSKFAKFAYSGRICTLEFVIVFKLQNNNVCALNESTLCSAVFYWNRS